MGLDICYYTNIKKVDRAAFDEHGDLINWDTEFRAHDYYWNDWPNMPEGLEKSAVYSYDDRKSFRAGSYGGYNQWRSQLAIFAGYKSDREVWFNSLKGPFAELINFTDCDGIIGPMMCAKLAKDFQEHREKAEQEGDEYFLELYKLFQEAFEKAANSGAVEFC